MICQQKDGGMTNFYARLYNFKHVRVCFIPGSLI